MRAAAGVEPPESVGRARTRRHGDVHEEDVGPIAGKKLEGIARGRGCPDFRAAMLEHGIHQMPRVLVIVDDQDPDALERVSFEGCACDAPLCERDRCLAA